MRTQILIHAFVALCFSCTLAPKYEKPKLIQSSRYSINHETFKEDSSQLTSWYTLLNDPILNDLIKEGIENNLDLKIAKKQLLEARALLKISKSDLFPPINASASITQTQMSQSTPTGQAISAFGGNTKNTMYEAGFDTSWELDLFGAKQSEIKAQKAGFQISMLSERHLLVSVVAELARQYITLRSFQARLKIAKENLKAQNEALRITQNRYKHGISSELDVSQAHSLVLATQANIPSLETGVFTSKRIIALLLAKEPKDIPDALNKDVDLPQSPPTLPIQLPSEMLENRPDVLMSEQKLKQAYAKIGIARSLYFPKIILNAGFGFQSTGASDLFKSASQFWSLGPTIRWPIFQAGKIRAQISIETLRQEQAFLQYHQTLLNALAEVENAMVRFLNERTRLISLDEAAQMNKKTFELANNRYLSGVADFLNVIDAQRNLYQAQDLRAQSEETLCLHFISLYKAFGGASTQNP